MRGISDGGERVEVCKMRSSVTRHMPDRTPYEIQKESDFLKGLLEIIHV